MFDQEAAEKPAGATSGHDKWDCTSGLTCSFATADNYAYVK